MPNRNFKIISCSAMAHILRAMIGRNAEMIVLDIALHLNPMKLRARLQKEIAAIEKRGWTSFWAMASVEGRSKVFFH